MRFVAAAGQGVGAGSMTRAEHREWLKDLVSLKPGVVGLTEQWRPGYWLNLYKTLPPLGYRVAVQKWPYGGGGVGLFWSSVLGKGPERGGFRLHGVVMHGGRVVSGFRSLRWVVLPYEGHQIACASFHITPYPGRGGSIRRAWDRGMARVRGWARTQLAKGIHVAIMCDSNAYADAMARQFGETFAGEPVRIVSDGLCHIVLLGRWDVSDTGVLKGTTSDHRPVWADASPR